MSFSNGGRGFLPPQNEQEKLVMRRAQDLFRAACGRGAARYSGFLSDREQALCQAALNAAGCAEYSFEGGYPAAERKLLCIEPAGAVSAPPICCVKLKCAAFAGAGAPAHKDYMGSLLGLGLERSCLGDILQDPEHAGTAYAFLLERAAGLVCAELAFVGRVAVKVQQCEGPAAAPEPERQMCSATVPSLRADAVLAAMLHCSRGQAGQLVRAGGVEIGHVPVTSPHAPVYEGDIFTVRGKGRFQLAALGGKIRKDRLFIEYFQY